MIYSDNTFDITNNIATYTRRDFKSVFDTTSSKWYMLNNLNNYEEYGIYGNSFDTYYTGKLVIVNDHEYEWNGTEWVDLGEATGEKRNVKFSEYFPDRASFTKKTINNVHWDMRRPAATVDSEDVYFSYDGPGSTSSLVPRFSMYFDNGVYTDTGFTDRKILRLSKDSDGYYYYNFGGEMYLSNYKSSFNNYLNYTTWNYAYTFIDTTRWPKYYTEKSAPTISTLFASTIYRNSAHLTTLMRNDVEQVIWNYNKDDILKKGEYINLNQIQSIYRDSSHTGNIKFPQYIRDISSFSATFKFTQSGGGVFLGSNGSSDSNDWRMFFHQGEIYYDCGSGRTHNSQIKINNTYNLLFSGNPMKLTNITTGAVIYTGNTTRPSSGDYNFCFGFVDKYGSGGGSSTDYGYLYDLVFYSDNEGKNAIAHYIPYIQNDTVGMYDKINNVFVAANGTIGYER